MTLWDVGELVFFFLKDLRELKSDVCVLDDFGEVTIIVSKCRVKCLKIATVQDNPRNCYCIFSFLLSRNSPLIHLFKGQEAADYKYQ